MRRPRTAQALRGAPCSMCDIIRYGYFSQVRLLVDSGEDFECRESQTRRTPLMLCALMEPPEWGASVAMTLLEVGARAFLTDVHGCTALHLACVWGREWLVRVLLRAIDFDLAKQDKHGNTPLHLAGMSGDVAVTQLVAQAHRRYGVTVCRTNLRGLTAEQEASNAGYTSCAHAISFTLHGRRPGSASKDVRFAEDMKSIPSCALPKLDNGCVKQNVSPTPLKCEESKTNDDEEGFRPTNDKTSLEIDQRYLSGIRETQDEDIHSVELNHEREDFAEQKSYNARRGSYAIITDRNVAIFNQSNTPNDMFRDNESIGKASSISCSANNNGCVTNDHNRDAQTARSEHVMNRPNVLDFLLSMPEVCIKPNMMTNRRRPVTATFITCQDSTSTNASMEKKRPTGTCNNQTSAITRKRKRQNPLYVYGYKKDTDVIQCAPENDFRNTPEFVCKIAHLPVEPTVTDVRYPTDTANIIRPRAVVYKMNSSGTILPYRNDDKYEGWRRQIKSVFKVYEYQCSASWRNGRKLHTEPIIPEPVVTEEWEKGRRGRRQSIGRGATGRISVVQK